MKEHYSVLLEESIALLNIKPDGIYVDGTFGRGGHSQQILNKLGALGRLIIVDKDLEAIIYAKEHFKDKRVIIVHDSFAQIGGWLTKLGIKSVDGILLDLGVSSPQLDNKERGFSFRFSGPLDMRMNTSQGITAREWISSVSEADLADVLWRYGEERFSRRIARQIVLSRKISPITTTGDLASIITQVLPFKEKGQHPATRSFQAIRIYINSELEDLEQFLLEAHTLLGNKGRIVIISFHSLEDRLVKQAFNRLASGEKLPKWVTKVPELAKFKVIAKKLRAGTKELMENSRSRSAVLRTLEKV